MKAIYNPLFSLLNLDAIVALARIDNKAGFSTFLTNLKIKSKAQTKLNRFFSERPEFEPTDFTEKLRLAANAFYSALKAQSEMSSDSLFMNVSVKSLNSLVDNNKRKAYLNAISSVLQATQVEFPRQAIIEEAYCLARIYHNEKERIVVKPKSRRRYQRSNESLQSSSSNSNTSSAAPSPGSPAASSPVSPAAFSPGSPAASSPVSPAASSPVSSASPSLSNMSLEVQRFIPIITKTSENSKIITPQYSDRTKQVIKKLEGLIAKQIVQDENPNWWARWFHSKKARDARIAIAKNIQETLKEFHKYKITGTGVYNLIVKKSSELNWHSRYFRKNLQRWTSSIDQTVHEVARHEHEQPQTTFKKDESEALQQAVKMLTQNNTKRYFEFPLLFKTTSPLALYDSVKENYGLVDYSNLLFEVLNNSCGDKEIQKADDILVQRWESLINENSTDKKLIVALIQYLLKNHSEFPAIVKNLLGDSNSKLYQFILSSLNGLGSEISLNESLPVIEGLIKLSEDIDESYRVADEISQRVNYIKCDYMNALFSQSADLNEASGIVSSLYSSESLDVSLKHFFEEQFLKEFEKSLQSVYSGADSTDKIASFRSKLKDFKTNPLFNTLQHYNPVFDNKITLLCLSRIFELQLKNRYMGAETTFKEALDKNPGPELLKPFVLKLIQKINLLKDFEELNNVDLQNLCAHGELTDAQIALSQALIQTLVKSVVGKETTKDGWGEIKKAFEFVETLTAGDNSSFLETLQVFAASYIDRIIQEENILYDDLVEVVQFLKDKELLNEPVYQVFQNHYRRLFETEATSYNEHHRAFFNSTLDSILRDNDPESGTNTSNDLYHKYLNRYKSQKEHKYNEQAVTFERSHAALQAEILRFEAGIEEALAFTSDRHQSSENGDVYRAVVDIPVGVISKEEKEGYKNQYKAFRETQKLFIFYHQLISYLEKAPVSLEKNPLFISSPTLNYMPYLPPIIRDQFLARLDQLSFMETSYEERLVTDSRRFLNTCQDTLGKTATTTVFTDSLNNMASVAKYHHNKTLHTSIKHIIYTILKLYKPKDGFYEALLPTAKNIHRHLIERDKGTLYFSYEELQVEYKPEKHQKPTSSLLNISSTFWGKDSRSFLALIDNINLDEVTCYRESLAFIVSLLNLRTNYFKHKSKKENLEDLKKLLISYLNKVKISGRFSKELLNSELAEVEFLLKQMQEHQNKLQTKVFQLSPQTVEEQEADCLYRFLSYLASCLQRQHYPITDCANELAPVLTTVPQIKSKRFNALAIQLAKIKHPLAYRIHDFIIRQHSSLPVSGINKALVEFSEYYYQQKRGSALCRLKLIESKSPVLDKPKTLIEEITLYFDKDLGIQIDMNAMAEKLSDDINKSSKRLFLSYNTLARSHSDSEPLRSLMSFLKLNLNYSRSKKILVIEMFSLLVSLHTIKNNIGSIPHALVELLYLLKTHRELLRYLDLNDDKKIFKAYEHIIIAGIESCEALVKNIQLSVGAILSETRIKSELIDQRPSTHYNSLTPYDVMPKIRNEAKGVISKYRSELAKSELASSKKGAKNNGAHSKVSLFSFRSSQLKAVEGLTHNGLFNKSF